MSSNKNKLARNATQQIQIKGKIAYSFFQKLFCCKCLTCCQKQDETLLTKKHRNQKSRQLIQRFLRNTSTIQTDNIDTMQVLIHLYIQDSESGSNEIIDQIIGQLSKCRINPNMISNKKQRDDLEFYLPQICTYLIFHQTNNDEEDRKLLELLKTAASMNFYFAHHLYFYLSSLRKAVMLGYEEQFPVVDVILKDICNYLQLEYQERKLIVGELINQMNQNNQQGRKQNGEYVPVEVDNCPRETINQRNLSIQQYGTLEYKEMDNEIIIRPSHIVLENYQSIFEQDQSLNNSQSEQTTQRFIKNSNHGFLSTINFLEDLVKVSESLNKVESKIFSLIQQLRKINTHLPAAVYIPFYTNSVRHYSVLNIVVEESKVFSTKERAPFYICLEIYRPEEELEMHKNLQGNNIQEFSHQYIWDFDQQASAPIKCIDKSSKLIDKKKSRKLSLDNSQMLNNLQDGQMENKLLNQSQNQSIAEDTSYYRSQTSSIDQSQSTERKTIYNSCNKDLEDFNSVNRQESPQNSQSLSFSPNNSKFINNNSTNDNNNSNELNNGSKSNSNSNIQNNQQNNNFEKKNTISLNKENDIITFDISKGPKEIELQEQKSFRNRLRNESKINKVNNKKNLGAGVSKFYQAGGDQMTMQEIYNMINEEQQDSQNITDQNLQKRLSKEIILQFNENTDKDKNNLIKEDLEKILFGEDENKQKEKIRQKSPYKHFKSYKLVHMIIKTGDNLKQEQFAIQLIYQFDQIFKDEGLNLKIRPYEIISLGPDSGLVEMVKNATTMDQLKKCIDTDDNFKNIQNLNEFFKVFYGNNLKQAQENFCSSLAAYSLICYFMQIKDRHNGNILLHKDGYLLHIDFGFFFSNAPGKGLQFEKKVPFKLLSEYIDILGGVESKLFEQFRKLFFKGFMAARKHQDKILILVKMLYSGHGSTLPCFEKGEEAITELDERFNPRNMKSDGEFFIHTQNLINQSLDNWRARWYDKFQYFCQGIYY